MKKGLAGLIVVMVFLSSLAFAEVTQEASKFTMSYTVIYNSVTLDEAGKIEMRIKKENKDACSVSVESKNADNAGFITFNYN